MAALFVFLVFANTIICGFMLSEYIGVKRTLSQLQSVIATVGNVQKSIYEEVGDDE